MQRPGPPNGWWFRRLFGELRPKFPSSTSRENCSAEPDKFRFLPPGARRLGSIPHPCGKRGYRALAPSGEAKGGEVLQLRHRAAENALSARRGRGLRRIPAARPSVRQRRSRAACARLQGDGIVMAVAAVATRAVCERLAALFAQVVMPMPLLVGVLFRTARYPGRRPEA